MGPSFVAFVTPSCHLTLSLLTMHWSPYVDHTHPRTTFSWQPSRLPRLIHTRRQTSLVITLVFSPRSQYFNLWPQFRIYRAQDEVCFPTRNSGYQASEGLTSCRRLLNVSGGLFQSPSTSRCISLFIGSDFFCTFLDILYIFFWGLSAREVLVASVVFHGASVGGVRVST